MHVHVLSTIREVLPTTPKRESLRAKYAFLLFLFDEAFQHPVWAGFIKPNIGGHVKTDVGLDEASPTYKLS